MSTTLPVEAAQADWPGDSMYGFDAMIAQIDKMLKAAPVSRPRQFYVQLSRHTDGRSQDDGDGAGTEGRMRAAWEAGYDGSRAGFEQSAERAELGYIQEEHGEYLRILQIL